MPVRVYHKPVRWVLHCRQGGVRHWVNLSLSLLQKWNIIKAFYVSLFDLLATEKSQYFAQPHPIIILSNTVGPQFSNSNSEGKQKTVQVSRGSSYRGWWKNSICHVKKWQFGFFSTSVSGAVQIWLLSSETVTWLEHVLW